MKTRKELKEEYKRRKARMGVFQIRNIAGNKVLIESSVDIDSTWNRHKAELRFGTHRSRALQEDWKAQGEAGFAFEVLSELESRDEEGVDYNRELKTLQDMIVQELDLSDERRYKLNR